MWISLRWCDECRNKTKKRWNIWSNPIFVMKIIHFFRFENDLVENESVDGKLLYQSMTIIWGIYVHACLWKKKRALLHKTDLKEINTTASETAFYLNLKIKHILSPILQTLSE